MTTQTEDYHALKVALHHALRSAVIEGRSLVALSAELQIPATTLTLLHEDAATAVSEDQLKRLTNYFWRA